jgi:hypothetical protein
LSGVRIQRQAKQTVRRAVARSDAGQVDSSSGCVAAAAAAAAGPGVAPSAAWPSMAAQLADITRWDASLIVPYDQKMRSGSIPALSTVSAASAIATIASSSSSATGR